MNRYIILMQKAEACRDAGYRAESESMALIWFSHYRKLVQTAEALKLAVLK
jgi:hypothetical protein